jgi:flagellar biosynthesis protein FlhG
VTIGKDQASGLRKVTGGQVVTLASGKAPATRVVAITGGKGGVGKSSIAVNLACTYAQRGARTIAFDADLGMADLNLLLGIAPEDSLADVLAGKPIEEVLHEAHGIHLLPGLNGSYRLANLGEHERHALLAAIDSLDDRFDTLVVDTGAGITASNVDFAGAAGQIVVVATPEPLSLADAYACLKALAARCGVTRAFVLPNQVRSPSEADEVFGRLAALTDRFLDIELTALPAIPHDASLRQASAAGVPLVLHNPDAPASRAFKQVARRIDALARPDERSGGVKLFARRMATQGAQP